MTTMNEEIKIQREEISKLHRILKEEGYDTMEGGTDNLFVVRDDHPVARLWIKFRNIGGRWNYVPDLHNPWIKVRSESYSDRDTPDRQYRDMDKVKAAVRSLYDANVARAASRKITLDYEVVLKDKIQPVLDLIQDILSQDDSELKDWAPRFEGISSDKPSYLGLIRDDGQVRIRVQFPYSVDGVSAPALSAPMDTIYRYSMTAHPTLSLKELSALTKVLETLVDGADKALNGSR